MKVVPWAEEPGLLRHEPAGVAESSPQPFAPENRSWALPQGNCGFPHYSRGPLSIPYSYQKHCWETAL